MTFLVILAKYGTRYRTWLQNLMKLRIKQQKKKYPRVVPLYITRRSRIGWIIECQLN